MDKPTKLATRRNRKRSKNGQPKEAPKQTSIPLSAVPHLYNEKMLEWQQVNFNALKAIHEKLEEILGALKEE